MKVSRLTKELASSTNEGRILKEEISSLQKTNKSLNNEKQELTFEYEAQVGWGESGKGSVEDILLIEIFFLI